MGKAGNIAVITEGWKHWKLKSYLCDWAVELLYDLGYVALLCKCCCETYILLVGIQGMRR